MDYPHGHHPHHGRDRREEEEEEDYPPPGRLYPPPFYGENEPPPPFYGLNDPPPPFPPPPQVYHSSHIGPRPDSYPHSPPPPFPPPPQVYHSSRIGPRPDSYPHPPPPSIVDNPHHHHPHMPHFPSIVDHHKGEELAKKPSVKMYCKAETNYYLTIRDGKVVLGRADPSDPFQHWIKDEKLSTRVKDEEGFPSFALINKATGEAMKHSIGATHPVQLVPYNPNVLDESILWTESKDLGDGYRAIRMVNNIRLNVDAFHGDKNHGGVHDGSTIVLWEWKKGDNQRWKIVPY